MRIFCYELKKVCNVKLVILTVLLTYFYVQVYYYEILHFADGFIPGSDVYITYLSKTLRDDVGMTIHESELYLLDEIYQEMIKDKNVLIQENEILKEEGITTAEQMDNAMKEYGERAEAGEERAKQVMGEIDRILFLDGPVANSVEDEIRRIQENLYVDAPGNVNFLCDTWEEAQENAKKALSYGGNSAPEPFMINWLAKFYYTDEMSLIPQWLMTVLQLSFPKLATIMLISAIVMILPWQIRERLARVKDLQGSSAIGRKLWDRQLLASLTMVAGICVFQMIVFVLALRFSDMTYYWDYPVYVTEISGGAEILFPFTMGEYVYFSMGLITLFTLACTVFFHLISKMAGNYVVGYAMVIAPFLILNYLGSRIFMGFQHIYATLWETASRYVILLVWLMLAAALAGVMSWIHSRRDVAS